MKLLIFLVVAVIGAQAAAESPTRANLIVGYIAVGDTLLHTSFETRRAITNTVQTHDVTYRGSILRRITAVRAEEIGGTQRGSARIVNGGIGQNTVTVRFTSVRGGGYNYQLTVWGR